MQLDLGYYDISPEISKDLGVFPGDIAFAREISYDFKKGDHLLLSSINTTLHIGAHADAPNHYHPQGLGIAARDLKTYFGKCEVREVYIGRGERIELKHVQGWQPRAKRVLFKTGTFPDPNHWNSDFAALSPKLIEYLAYHGVILVGIDTPSIDPEDAKDLISHHAVAQNNLAILEGLILSEVPEGLYSLIALPLRIRDADAAPVRAILHKSPELFSE